MYSYFRFRYRLRLLRRTNKTSEYQNPSPIYTQRLVTYVVLVFARLKAQQLFP